MKELEPDLEKLPFIWYFLTFQDQTKALLDSENGVNVIIPTFAS